MYLFGAQGKKKIALARNKVKIKEFIQSLHASPKKEPLIEQPCGGALLNSHFSGSCCD